MTEAWTTGMSRWLIALNTNLPIPGYEKTVSTTTTPPSKKPHDYRRQPTDDYVLSEEQIESVDRLLGRRLAAKRARDFDLADALQAELRALGIEVDDKARLWYVRYHDGGRAASSFRVRGW